MSWSVRIICLYVGFVAIILTLVVICFNHKTELEYKDYYVREIGFQEQITGQENARDLPEPIRHSVEGNSVYLFYPHLIVDGLSGNIELLRPADASKDISVDAAPGPDGSQVITGLVKGVYKLRMRLRQNDKFYFEEAVINIR